MIRGIKVLLLLLLISRASCYSQELSHQVLVPAAGLATAGAIDYSQTIGETAVEIIGSEGFELTQGFQQPRITISLVPVLEGSGVDVYPNPATDFIDVKLFGDVARKFRIEIINITGMIVNTMTLNFITNYNYIQQIDITRLTIGFYLVKVASDDSKIYRIFKIEKL